MNIQFESIYLPSFFSGVENHGFGDLQGHIVRNVEILSQYVRYNELTLAGSVLAINLGFISLAEKIMKFAPERLNGQFFQRPWIYHPSVILFKATVVGAGLSVVNRYLNLQLGPSHMAISVAASIALKILWKNVFSPELNLWMKKENTEACGACSPRGSVKLSDDDEVLELDPADGIEDTTKSVDKSISSPISSPRSGETGNAKAPEAVDLPEQTKSEDQVLDDSPIDPPKGRRSFVTLPEMTPSEGAESMLQTDALEAFNERLKDYTG